MSVNNRHHLRLTLSKLVLIIARHSSLNFSLKVSGLLNPSRLAVSHRETGGSSFIIVFNFSSILRRDCFFLYSARFEDIERHKSGNLPRKATPVLKFKLQAISGTDGGYSSARALSSVRLMVSLTLLFSLSPIFSA